MYEFAPYPDLGADLKNLNLYLDPVRKDLESRENVQFLDVGCGTGHILVGVAKAHPQWTCHGLDLSSASLAVASSLAEKHDVTVSINRGSYLDPLPYTFEFDVICAMGTIHHCAEPVTAMRNLKRYLKGDGYLLMHMYGMRADREKFDIKEMLNILQPEITDYDSRFGFYKALMDHKERRWLKRLALTNFGELYGAVRNKMHNLRRRRNRTSWSPSFRETYTEVDAPWIDHFCHPCERAYEVPEIRDLIEQSGFRVIRMLKQGRENMKLIPPEWRERYSQLDDWEKWQLSELLSVGGGSFAMILRHEEFDG